MLRYASKDFVFLDLLEATKKNLVTDGFSHFFTHSQVGVGHVTPQVASKMKYLAVDAVGFHPPEVDPSCFASALAAGRCCQQVDGLALPQPEAVAGLDERILLFFCVNLFNYTPDKALTFSYVFFSSPNPNKHLQNPNQTTQNTKQPLQQNPSFHHFPAHFARSFSRSP